jgi:creatinine amidohydrolase
VVIRREVVFALLENICDEMGRHGIKKIILFSGHGGNRYFLPLFVQTLPEKEKDYVAYYVDLPLFPDVQDLIEAPEVGHACEIETSMLLAIRAELVKRGQIPSQPFLNLKRNQELAEVGAYSPVDWYAMYPAMYVGDAGYATAEKGRLILERHVELLVDLIRAVKADAVTAELLAEFQAGKRKPGVPEAWV